MFKTRVEIPQNHLVDYQSNYLFLGSCFSEHLSQRMIQSGFNIHTNPFGVVFNPISLADSLLISDKQLKDSVFDRDGVALSWLANSTCFAYNQEELKIKLVELRNAYIESLLTAKVLFVTFGTAWVYTKKSIDHIVGNCHKAAKNDFEKRLLSIEEIVIKWTKVIEKLQSESSVKIVFTVSPVRHTKDGLLENSRGKAILLSAIHELKDKFSNVGYFPAYELMIDEMRDYAFYTKDGVHPNSIAIDEIWSRFKATYFTEETMKVCQEYDKLRMLFQHRFLHPESKAAKQFEVDRVKKLEDFKLRYPGFNHKAH